jgi:hypothetical protein
VTRIRVDWDAWARAFGLRQEPTVGRATGISQAEFRSIFRMPPSHPLTATRAAFLVAPVADTPIYDELVAERGRPRLDDPDA